GRLIMMFRARRCVFAEDLADVTFERVVRKLANLTAEFSGDPARYFYAVAKKIYLEYQREITNDYWKCRRSLSETTDNPDMENKLQQLDDALDAIPNSDRDLILKYYASNGKTKIIQRRALAEQFGIQPYTLRQRIFRIRKDIKTYMIRTSPETNN